MTAFGPYADTEIIDFTKLEGRNIFLITGPTGSGKTTIFDGISYGIYGEASGQERDGENLRSQWADIDKLTYVELEFQLRNKRYTIKRTPRQEKRKSRGEGITEHLPEAELKIWEEDSQVITGVKNVNEKMNEIMGITCDQFRQIMMIPQGDFRRLLTSDSKEREKIMQKIFNTEIYKLVEVKLNEKAKSLKTEALHLKNRLLDIIKKIEADSNIELLELIGAVDINRSELKIELCKEIQKDEEKILQMLKDIEGKDKLLGEKQKERIKAEDNNRKLQERLKLEYEKKQLDNQRDSIFIKKNMLQSNKKAAEILWLEEGYLEKERLVLNKKQKLQEVSGKVKLCSNTLEGAAKNYYLEKDKEVERLELNNRLLQLNEYKKRVESYLVKKNSMLKYEDEFNRLAKEKKRLTDKLIALKAEAKIIAEELETSRKAQNCYIIMKNKLDSLQLVLKKLKQTLQENQKLEEIEKEYLVAQEESKRVEEYLEIAESTYNEMQEEWYKGQAGLLAKDLQQGDLCPVCGSQQHPSLAQLQEGIPSSEELKEKRDQLSQLEKQYKMRTEDYTKASGRKEVQIAIINNLKGELKVLLEDEPVEGEGRPLEIFLQEKVLTQQIEQDKLSLEVRQLEKEKNKMKELEIRNEEVNKEASVTEKSLENTENQYSVASNTFNRERALLEAITQEIPKELLIQEILLAKIDEVSSTYYKRVKLLEELENKYHDSKLKMERVIAEKTAVESAFKEALSFLNDAKEKFDMEVMKAGFIDKAEYQKYKSTKDEIEALEEEIQSYQERLKSISDRYIQITMETAGLTLVELDNLDKEYNVLKEELEEMNSSRTKLYAKIERNNQISKDIEEFEKLILGVEQDYSYIGHLSEIAKGNNTEGLTFERYVLAAFLENVLSAANNRLVPMTSGRYELNRTDQRARSNAQSGLELEVYDHYTGKTRHVKTLSGGEGFKASLALALGLSDVVQSYTGGISLDTIFIDEGFGTLDSESLDGAIGALMELQNSGRLVGIISHVPELKERIGVRLEVQPSRTGSKTRFIL